ncbi:hypothetical protein IHQ68_18715 [Chelatococcus sambhunathii]|uniref:Phytase-like domain-containing protein n=1 Tax=Chelatococcus sambhunathii TaxID=363953 RepID=A0ABU1DKK8_9HYPH|nr:hypothetical protein [Chelatococcus sambhunathii]MDR4308658.1 hypothetical protein [Chelatococcus sambhunathii]
MRRFLRAAVAALWAGFAGIGAAGAVEIVGSTGQVNPKSDPDNTVFDSVLIEDAKGGFGVYWGKNGGGRLPIVSQLLVRSYDAKLKPLTGPLRFDAPIDGVTPDFYFIRNGTPLDKNRSLLAYEARAEGANHQFAGQYFKAGKPQKGPAHLEDTPFAVQGDGLLPLLDGRGLAYVTENLFGNGYRGRLVKRDGTLGPLDIDLSGDDGDGFHQAAALDEGFAAVRVRVEDSKFQLLAQVYDKQGAPEGELFPLTDFLDRFGTNRLIGLRSGKLLYMRFLDDAGRGDITGQLFSRTGKKIGKTVALMKDVGFQQTISAIALDKGLMIAASDGDPAFEGKKFVLYASFDDKLKRVGKIAKTKPAKFLVRGQIRLLSDGRVAASHVVDAKKLLVDILEP